MSTQLTRGLFLPNSSNKSHFSRIIQTSIKVIFRMASEESRAQSWIDNWHKGKIGFHKTEVHHMLIKHFDNLFPDGKKGRVFVPLCGKTLDMKWFSEQNIKVVGLDAARVSMEQFFSENNIEYKIENVTSLGKSCELFKSCDDSIHIYCGNMMNFNMSITGQFEAVWDRASLVALQRVDVKRYVENIKSLLTPGGRCLLETMDYDVSIMNDIGGDTRPPPPFPMYEAEIKLLFEPECTVQYLDREERTLQNKDIHLLIFLITKL